MRLLNGNEFSVSGRARAGLGAGGPGAGGSDSVLPHPDSTVEDNPAWESQRVILAVFLGGCTFSEIAALRFLGKERGKSHWGGQTQTAASRGAVSRQELWGLPWSQCKAEWWPRTVPAVADPWEGGAEIPGPPGTAQPSAGSPLSAPRHGRGWRGALAGPLPAGCKFIFLTTAITNSARMMEAMIEAKA